MSSASATSRDRVRHGSGGSAGPPLPDRLAPPPQPGRLVSRERLLRRIAGPAAPGVVLIHAPAGYGKSTLLAQLAAADARDVTWLSLERRDNDPVVLLSDLAHALVRPDAGGRDELAERLLAHPPAAVPLALPMLVRLLGDGTRPRLIVLDDLHRIVEGPALDVVEALISNLARGSALALASRSRPPLPIARLMVEGKLDELRARDLRMTVAEGSEMLRRADARVSEAEARLLVRDTEGWPAALYLAALALRAKPEGAPERLREVGGDELAEYFHEEVLSAAPAGDREFLLRTSILDELRPGLCDAVLQRDDSAERLRELAGADLFVSPADPGGRGGTCRVHALVRENLLLELRREDPEAEPELHVRASEWWAQAGDLERAIRHALAAGEPTRAADLLWSVAVSHIAGGRVATISRWLSWFEPADLRDIPCLALAAGWAALDEGRVDEAAEWAGAIRRLHPGTLLADGLPARASALLLAAGACADGVRSAGDDTAAAERILDAHAPPDSPWWAVSRLIAGAMALMRGEVDAAAESLRDGRARAAHRVPTAYSLCCAELALIAVTAGDASSGRAGDERALRQLVPAEEYPLQAMTAAARALARARSGEPAAAREDALVAARVLAAGPRMPWWLAVQARAVLAEAFGVIGSRSIARQLLDEAREVAAPDPDATWLAAYVDRVAADLDRAPASTPGGAVLTTAELRTLQYLPTHLSLQEVGERLSVSRNTVKTHTISIYRKLDVSSRSEAVARGRELGLLEA